jgi:hypothetical protein
MLTMPEHYGEHRASDVEDKDDDIFAELEAELENDDHAAVREGGMQELKKQ